MHKHVYMHAYMYVHQYVHQAVSMEEGMRMENEIRMGAESVIRPELFIMEMEAASDEDALDQLASLLHRYGLVRKSFGGAVKERERRYSTGLAFPGMGIAIPHADAEHVIAPAVAVGILKEPVQFRHMGMPEQLVDVQMVFMLALQDEEEQPEQLAGLLDVFQGEGNLGKLKACRTKEEAADCLAELLQSVGMQ